MDPNEALLLSVESILDDGELDDASRHTALAETVQQYVDYTGAAKAVIMKRDDDEQVDGVEAGIAIDNDPIRERLRRLYEDQRRSFPNLGDANALASAWRLLNRADRNALLAEEDDGEDPTFDHEIVDVEKLADFALECRAVAIGKIQPGLTREQAMAAAVDEKPELFQIARDAKRAKLADGNTEPDNAVIAARHFALQAIHKHAEAIRAAEPRLSIQAARIEARRLNPELAARERA
jgi:hypothetical protein